MRTMWLLPLLGGPLKGVIGFLEKGLGCSLG